MLPSNFLETYEHIQDRIKEDTRTIKRLELMKQANLERLRTMKAPRLQLACEYLAKVNEYKLTDDFERLSKLQLEAKEIERKFEEVYCQNIKEWIKEKGLI